MTRSLLPRADDPALADVPVPPQVRALAGQDQPEAVWVNERGGISFRAGTRFIKWNPHGTGLDLVGERLRMQWAARWHAVPQVLDAGADDQAQWLVTAALPGLGAVTNHWLARPLQAAQAIGRGLRMLHDALPVADCPFDWSIATRIQHRVPVEQLKPPAIDRLVVCHGDACAPNTIIAPDGSPAGHVDLGALGVADRWADLAVASMSLDWNYGPAWEDAFFAAYGVARDEERIAFYRHLWDHEDQIGQAGRSA